MFAVKFSIRFRLFFYYIYNNKPEKEFFMTDEELNSLFAKSANIVANLAAETASLVAENASLVAAGKETDRRLNDLSVKIAETDRIVQENAIQMRETDRRIDKVSKQIGGIDNNIGYHAEQFFQNVFSENKVFGGIEYDEIIPNLKHGDKTGEVEFDIVLENCDSVALIEVKNRIHPNFVKKLAEERVGKFRRYFPEYKNYDVYLGIAGFSFNEDVLEEAKKYGVGIVRQAGDGIEVDATGLRAYR
jgi:hypothetical protein